MKIQLNYSLLFGTRIYAIDDVLDLEVDSEKKKELVSKGLARWYTPPKEETATVKIPNRAVRHKPKD